MSKIKNWSRIEDEDLPAEISVSWKNDSNPQIVFIRRTPIVPSLMEEPPKKEVMFEVMISDEVTCEPKSLFIESDEGWRDVYDRTVEWLKNNPDGSDERAEKVEEARV